MIAQARGNSRVNERIGTGPKIFTGYTSKLSLTTCKPNLGYIGGEQRSVECRGHDWVALAEYFQRCPADAGLPRNHWHGSQSAPALVTHALITGNLDTAVELCIQAGRWTDALLLAQDEGLGMRTRMAYFDQAGESGGYLRVLKGVMQGRKGLGELDDAFASLVGQLGDQAWASEMQDEKRETARVFYGRETTGQTCGYLGRRSAGRACERGTGELQRARERLSACRKDRGALPGGPVCRFGVAAKLSRRDIPGWNDAPNVMVPQCHTAPSPFPNLPVTGPLRAVPPPPRPQSRAYVPPPPPLQGGGCMRRHHKVRVALLCRRCKEVLIPCLAPTGLLKRPSTPTAPPAKPLPTAPKYRDAPTTNTSSQQKRMVDDIERRLNVLFDALDCETLSLPVVDQVITLVQGA
ncbi:hypothetical protein CTheo_5738 [Ceratobasidium theobromae]|uniref:Uncharacterized protein n=1 Tax=Ceratobasidium theobromae TaxID=1582974 RepID=A0A5N5QH68_9AGAM|nr:hypothetical protein CTheo_5738 [Ceratobasidium theobromae]